MSSSSGSVAVIVPLAVGQICRLLLPKLAERLKGKASYAAQACILLLMFCAFGALLAVMHALLDEDYGGISYSVIMGANGGLAGIALAFLGAHLLGRGDGGTVILAMLYNATVWAAIAVARKLELLEQEEQPAEATAPDSPQDNP